MSQGYMSAKAYQNAQLIAQKHGIDFKTAYHITRSIWFEARACILRMVSAAEWQKLTPADKALVCQAVVKKLLDRGNIASFMTGGKKSLM